MARLVKIPVATVTSTFHLPRPVVQFCWNEANSVENRRKAHSGDAVLQYCTTSVVQQLYPSLPSSIANELRVAVVRNSTLQILAKHYCEDQVGPKQFERMSERRSGDLFESYVGAIHEEKGLAETEKFLEKIIVPLVKYQYDVLTKPQPVVVVQASVAKPQAVSAKSSVSEAKPQAVVKSQALAKSPSPKKKSRKKKATKVQQVKK